MHNQYDPSPNSVKTVQMKPEVYRGKNSENRQVLRPTTWKAEGVTDGESEDRDCDVCKMRLTRKIQL